MTTKQVIKQLESKGYSIKWRQRFKKVRINGEIVKKKEGVLITSINGEKFKGAKGNTKARQLAGAKMVSEKSIQALQKITQKHIEKVRKISVDELIKKQLKRTQRARIKYKRSDEGKVTKKKLQYYIESEGEERGLQYLRNRERYYQGYAYDENIQWRIDRLKAKVDAGQKQYQEVIDLMEQKRNFIRDEWLVNIDKEIYNQEEKVITIETAVQRIKAILGA